jgi:LmbE family N-acetylglucosaminyl deacetylase
MRSAVFLSPHLDDAVFSAGGTIAKLVGEGLRCRVVTVFTRSMPKPTGFALACQTDKGLSADADYMAIRRAEDVAACCRLGVPAADVVHLALPEAPHRGYTSAADLFAGVHADDAATTAAVREAASPYLTADRVYLPAGLGNHVDHLHVIAACRDAATAYWLDTPYVLRCEVEAGEVVAIAATLPAKLEACAAYATQLSFQFGGEAKMRATLQSLAGEPAVERVRARPVPARTSRNEARP